MEAKIVKYELLNGDPAIVRLTFEIKKWYKKPYYKVKDVVKSNIMNTYQYMDNYNESDLPSLMLTYITIKSFEESGLDVYEPNK